MTDLKLFTVFAVVITLTVAAALMLCIPHWTFFERMLGTLALTSFLNIPTMIIWDEENGENE